MTTTNEDTAAKVVESPTVTPTRQSWQTDELFEMYNYEEGDIVDEPMDTHTRDGSRDQLNLQPPSDASQGSKEEISSDLAKSQKPLPRKIPHQEPLLARIRRRKWVIICVLVALVVAAIVPVVLKVVNGKHTGSSSGASTATSGSSGSVVVTENGTTFTYTNNFGGDWRYDPTDPFAVGGKAQEWGKRIGEHDWAWGTDLIRGVNLGGWLVTEPFISPALYEKYVNKSNIYVADEYTLCLAMGDKIASELENHYKTFITEQDFAAIAGAGLNWVRIPIGFWAIDVVGDEPFLVGTSWTYMLRAIQWARKYGLRIYLDLHALPGSQNGWNHSGKSGSINFMNGVMGIANAQRTLSYLRIIVEFVSQPQYKDVVCMIGIVNEILWGTIGETSVKSFYWAAYQAIRNSTGTGAGKGPLIAIHDAFQGTKPWEGFLAGSDRLALDQHPYLAFMGDSSPVENMATKPCQWALATNRSQSEFGVTVGGEFSAAINNCGLWLNGINSVQTNPDCDYWDNWAGYNSSTVAGLKAVTLATMDALQNFFFWTWKIGESTNLKTSSSPMWHYKLGLEHGWIPKDPREAVGHCASVLGSSSVFNGQHPATAIGGSGAGQLASQTHTFPPPSMSPSFSGTQMSLLPTYTATGAIKTLFAPSFSAAPTVAVGNGWANPDDKELAYVPVSGCSYPNAWDAVNASLPTAPCT